MIEETKKRLENIQAIEPYLNAMRNTSLGSWKTALNRITAIHAFRKELLEILDALGNDENPNSVKVTTSGPSWIIIGSQKGLVSNFNRHLISLLEKELATFKSQSNYIVPVVTLITNRPSYFYTFFSKHAIHPHIVPFQYNLTYQSAIELMKNVPLLETRYSNTCYFYNQYAKSQNSIPVKQISFQSFPPTQLKEQSEVEPEWPPYLLDSDPVMVREQILNMLASLEFQEILTNSIASENAFRHRILEEAKNNTDRLINELTIDLAMARKKEITKEIQELAVAAGLIQ